MRLKILLRKRFRRPFQHLEATNSHKTSNY
jgi:hypothetical protein